MNLIPTNKIGMSLRDYFAAVALNGLLSGRSQTEDIPHRDDCVDAYRYADAMLEARK